MMKNMTIYRAYSAAHYLQESLLLAYAERDQLFVKYRMEDAEEKLRELAEGMGFDLTRREPANVVTIGAKQEAAE